ncbi:hypothetical protein EV360DRAFT_81170 [Lentinula raphanica]|nr:hypothetical protein EV360DRAFT_81170 [Lentinula raphanica]
MSLESPYLQYTNILLASSSLLAVTLLKDRFVAALLVPCRTKVVFAYSIIFDENETQSTVGSSQPLLTRCDHPRCPSSTRLLLELTGPGRLCLHSYIVFAEHLFTSFSPIAMPNHTNTHSEPKLVRGAYHLHEVVAHEAAKPQGRPSIDISKRSIASLDDEGGDGWIFTTIACNCFCKSVLEEESVELKAFGSTAYCCLARHADCQSSVRLMLSELLANELAKEQSAGNERESVSELLDEVPETVILRQLTVPVLAGTTANEGDIFIVIAELVAAGVAIQPVLDILSSINTMETLCAMAETTGYRAAAGVSVFRYEYQAIFPHIYPSIACVSHIGNPFGVWNVQHQRQRYVYPIHLYRNRFIKDNATYLDGLRSRSSECVAFAGMAGLLPKWDYRDIGELSESDRMVVHGVGGD